MIIASTLLSMRQSYLQATLAVMLFGLLVFGEQQGIIANYKLTGFVSHDLHRDGMFVFATFGVFATTIYAVVYMATNISAQLRSQQAQTERANAQLMQKDNLKNEYVLRLTHDIRGHLAAIQSCLGIVAEQMARPLNEKQDDLIERAARRASKCSAFVAALLKLTRMKLAGKVDLDYFSIRNPVFNALAAVERHGGKIWAENNQEGGSTFSFSIPKRGGTGKD